MTSPGIYRFRRSEIEHRIEEMIALLDAIDGDPDNEPNGDEEDVGMPEGWNISVLPYGRATILEDDEDGGDTEQNGDEDEPCFWEGGL